MGISSLAACRISSFLIVTLIICFVVNKFLSLCLSFDTNNEQEKNHTYGDCDVRTG